MSGHSDRAMAPVTAGLNVLRFLALLLALGSGTTAQEKPRFSGTWVLTDPASAPDSAARELIVKEASGERGTALVVERRFEDRLQSDRYDLGIIGGTVGGEVGRTPRDEVKRTIVSARQYGQTLVIQSGSYTGPTSFETREFSEREEVWTLDEDGTLTIVVTQRGSGAETVRTTATYRRK